MTVSSSVRKAGPFPGNGATTAFPFAFKVFSAGDITVSRTDALGVSTILSLGTDYTVTLNPSQDTSPGGTITYPLVGAALPVGQTLVGLSNLDATQNTDIQGAGRYLPSTIENAFDRLTMLIQQLEEQFGRAIVMSPSDSSSLIELPPVSQRANRFFGFDASGRPVMLTGTGGDTALRTDLASSAAGAALVSYKPAGIGAVARLMSLKLGESSLSVRDFGCVGDGVTDDAVNFQKAITQSQASGVPLYIPPGQYLIGSALNVTTNLTMRGAGQNITFLIANTNTQDIISVSTDNQVTFSDFSLAGKTTATAGALMRLTGNPSINLYSSLTNIRFRDGWDQLLTVAAASWSCFYCSFFSPKDAGVIIANTVNGDGGDMQMIGCIMIGGAIGTAVAQFSAGGLRFIGNKIINWANGYSLALSLNVGTGVLFIQGCSIESTTDTAIALSKGSGVGFSAVHISGNEINVCTTGIKMQPDSGPWLGVVTISDNDIEFGDPFRPALVGVGIDVEGVTQYSIHDNNILNHHASSGTGIALGTFATNGRIHDNVFGPTVSTRISGTLTGKSLIIHDNDGYNPVGGSAVTPTASPFTHTNGPTTADLSISATTGVTNITVGGVSILAAGTGANIPYNFRVGPNEAVVITYVGTLTVRKMTH